MSTHISAFMPETDEIYIKYKKVYDICEELGTSLPSEVEEYFDDEEPECKLQIDLKEGVHYVEYYKDSSVGFEVMLDELPKGITKIRFYNCY